MSIPILITTSSYSIEEFPAECSVAFNPYKRKLTEQELIELFDAHDPVGMIAGVEPITARALEHAPRLKAIARCGVGVDSIDADALRVRGIDLSVTPEAPAMSVSELTLTLMLMVLKRAGSLDRGMRQGQWKGAAGQLLSGKSVGIIGCGRIGSRVAQLVEAFGARPLGYDANISSHPRCEMLPLDELLVRSDIITIHVPLMPDTRHMIGAREFERMRPGAYLLNLARGPLVDEEALYAALTSGKLAGAGLDCFETEPYAGKLLELDNVCLSPHMGASALEARAMMENEALNNLINALSRLKVL